MPPASTPKVWSSGISQPSIAIGLAKEVQDAMKARIFSVSY